jgi:hypothetical protein
MVDEYYLRRRAAQETDFASRATNRRVAAAHDAMAAMYFSQLASIAELQERRLAQQRPPEL